MDWTSWKSVRRFLFRDKFYTSLNILGLSVGLSATLFIFLYVKDELSFDKFHSRVNDIYRVALTLKFEDLNVFLPMASPPLAKTMQAEIPEVEETVRLYGIDLNLAFRVDEKTFTEKRVLFADSNFFQFFDFRLKTGNPKTALSKPHSVVITSSLAKKYFNSEEVIGKLITIDGESYAVTGIAEPAPANSHLVFDALLSMSSNPLAESNVWMGNRFFTYIKLSPSAKIESAENKMDNLVLNHIGPDLENSLGITLKQFLHQGNKIGYDLKPLTETHLITKFPRDITPAGDIAYVYLFSFVGIILLFIACINFMNLSTSRSASRMKEASIRRTLGSTRVALVKRFMGESFLVTLIATILALASVYLLLPNFNLLSGKSLNAGQLLSPEFTMGVVIMVLFTALLCGSYPSLYLTSFKVTDALRGKSKGSRKNNRLRSILVVVQNTVAIGLIAFTLILFKQLQYINGKKLGLDKDGIVVLRNTARLESNREPLKNALLSESSIEAASYSDRLVFEKMSADAVRDPHREQSHILNFYVSDEDQLKVMGYELVAGRFFSKDFPADSNAVVVNEATVKEFGWSDIEGREMAADGDYRYKVIGVIKDFNYESLRNEIKPLMIVYSPGGNTLNIKYSGIAPAELIKLLESKWNMYGKGEPFEYSFLNEDFDALFRSEQRVSRLFVLFTGLVVFVACIGLFALASFTAEQKIKEIGIRKTLGASVTNIAVMLSGQFVRLVFIAILISGVPVYLASEAWLSEFAFRVEPGISPFVAAGASAIIIAVLTVSYQSIKAAYNDPVKALRSE